MTTLDHVLLTRFNLPSPGYERTVRSRGGWLESRVQLFERYCLPSVAAQTESGFAWLVYFDPESPSWLRERIESWRGALTPVFRASVSSDDLIADLLRVSGGGGDRILTSNLDNDDALAADFVARVQEVGRAADHTATAIYVARGLVAAADRLYLRTDRANAFCSVSAPWASPKTCWADWHNQLGRSMPMKLESGGPGWLQVVHGANVSNRVHGQLTSPGRHAQSFPGLLDGFPEPARGDRIWDAAVAQPGRMAREAGRGLIKRIIVAAAGRAGLDRVRTRIRKGAGLQGASPEGEVR